MFNDNGTRKKHPSIQASHAVFSGPWYKTALLLWDVARRMLLIVNRLSRCGGQNGPLLTFGSIIMRLLGNVFKTVTSFTVSTEYNMLCPIL